MNLKRPAIGAFLVLFATSGWVSAQLPGVWLDSLPSTFPSRSENCSPPYIELPIPTNFQVGCFDVGTGRPLDCLVNYQESTSLDGVPPGQVTEFTGGHAHDPERVDGKLATTKGILWSDLQPDLPVDEMVAFSGRTGNQFWRAVKNAPEASGVVRVSATGRLLQPGYPCVPGPPFWACDDAVTAHMELGFRVAVPGLVELPPSPGLYVRCGITASCTGQDNVSALHPSAFYGSPQMVAKVQAVAQRFQALYPDLELQLTDMSLPMGGLFDFRATWEQPHKRNRNGRSVDVSRKAWNKTTGARQYLTEDQINRLEDIAVDQLRLFEADEGPIHFELAPWTPATTCHP